MTITRGAEGQSLPSYAEVFRLCRGSSDGKFPPEAFHLSTRDKEQAVPRLSVWETTNTTVEQADSMTQNRNALAGFLLVSDVQQLRPEPDHPGVAHLAVEWEAARETIDGMEVLSKRPGAAGHCGITRLDQDRATDGTSLKAHRKSLYARLARLANGRKVLKVR